MPTAPWMKGPLLLQPDEVLNASKHTTRRSSNRNSEAPDKALFGKESGVRGKKVIKKIIRNVEKLKGNEVLEESEEFEIGNWFEEIGSAGGVKKFDGKMPWMRAEEELAMRMRKWVKVMKAGVTQAVVDEIRLVWRDNELVMLKFSVPLCRNMDRAREIVEMKTGGLVVWIKKDVLVVYRGQNHALTSKFSITEYSDHAGGKKVSSSTVSHVASGSNISTFPEKSEISTWGRSLCREDGEKESKPIVIVMEGDENSQQVTGSLYERETDRLLDGLGPRFIDLWMQKPLPVDADLLPEVIPRFRPPVRLSPPNTRPKLTDEELAYLRKLSHPLPFHFALGRNKNLKGLANAILKLWGKCLIAKIAIKWGIQNTDSEQMANELKGEGLPQGVTNLVANEPLAKTRTVGTLSEFQDLVTKYGELEKENNELDIQMEAQKEHLERELRNQECKLSILNGEIEKSVKKLAKLNSSWLPAEQDVDLETITVEDRECLRKMGLKLTSCLVLGRRGVFDGVIEGVHQHWKHREVVKVITMQREFVRVIYTAKLLIAESGGDSGFGGEAKRSHAIIIYRGKNYRRPSKLMTDNLLTKREALQRSIEFQRIGSLKFFAYQRQQRILDLKLKLAELRERRAGSPQG
ncbi:maize chloroplast splicing factor CRS1, putative isoform 2 [Hibiscus syriacus]|uniref:Chloroplast splicing factor CRS1, putative isoform 2 n=1 Tax=Hibiscus syriacus TaxID=106335 RepID=A0A6A2WMP8_HIBSY|nr:maize chloroplast splicing factor CRS1, putative isoform 2 [Hibiscus syriacus]